MAEKQQSYTELLESNSELAGLVAFAPNTSKSILSMSVKKLNALQGDTDRYL